MGLERILFGALAAIGAACLVGAVVGAVTR
jgi:hypothetical protein